MLRTYSIAIAAVLGLIGIAAWVLYSSANLPWQEKKEPVSVLEHSVTASGDREHTETSEFYDIKTTYPDKAPMQGAAGDAAVLSMETWVREAVAQFKSDGDVENLTEEDKAIIGFTADRKYTLDITYKRYRSPRTVSYVYMVYTDMLGAHPNGVYKTFMFDAQTGNTLVPGDVFSGEWLARLSTISRTEITAHLREMMGGEGEMPLFEEGLAPHASNFQNLYLDGDEVVILFDPYQVAAYAAGPQEVRIRRAELADILKPEYR